jgi:FdhD protein
LEFTAGLLLGEGVIKGREDIIALDHTAGLNDAVRVGLRARAKTRTAWLKLSSLSISACGLCGKAKLNLEALTALPPLPPGPKIIDIETLLDLPARQRAARRVQMYKQPARGGAVRCARKLRALRAGVGGTMPMDKLNGWTILSDGLPLQDHHAAEWMGEF